MNKYEFIVNLSRDFITLINQDYVYEVVNESYCQVLEKERDQVLGRKVSDIWGKELFDSAIKPRLDECFSGKAVHYIDQFKFGLSQRYIHVSFYPYSDGNKVTHALVFSHDITKLGKIESKLINYEYRDPLTGLFNKRSLDIILDMELEKAKRSKSENLRALMFINMDNLSEVRHRYGYEIGDILLENTGIRIKEILRNSDYIFHLEGNELVVLLTAIASKTDPGKVAQKILEVTSTPYTHGDFSIVLKSCMGIALFPDDGKSKETLIQNATAALSMAKKRESLFVLYDKSTHEKSMRELKLENDLHKAFSSDQFLLYYQPIIDASLTITGAEALIRWKHPEHGLIPPLDFIPIAERTGLINAIGTWALYTAVKQLTEWGKTYSIYISVNLSAREFRNDHLPEILQNAIKSGNGVEPGLLKIEITESEIFCDPEHSIKRMKALKEKGFDLLIDDFGTGQSSLSYLKTLPADIIKIDKMFVDELLTEQEDCDFLEKIIAMLKVKKKKIVIEGIGTREQFDILTGMDCDWYQGFFFSPPVPPAEFTKLLKKHGEPRKS